MSRAGESQIQDVSDTALWVAVYRAVETERPDALFRDPLAERLTGERGRRIAARMTGSRYTSWSVVIRTCVIDSFVRELAAQGVDTVLNLGAGLDTRPYRLELPASLRWIEVDYSHMVQRKNELLGTETPSCRLERVPLDLAQREERRKLFAKINAESEKVLVITEGVVPYLSEEDVVSLGADLLEQPNFRFWVVDYFSPEVGKRLRSRRRQKQMQNAPFRFFPADWFGFFEQVGWKPRDTRYLVEESEKLGRRVPVPFWVKLIHPFLPASSRERYRHMLAYILLERR